MRRNPRVPAARPDPARRRAARALQRQLHPDDAAHGGGAGLHPGQSPCAPRAVRQSPSRDPECPQRRSLAAFWPGLGGRDFRCAGRGRHGRARGLRRPAGRAQPGSVRLARRSRHLARQPGLRVRPAAAARHLFCAPPPTICSRGCSWVSTALYAHTVVNRGYDV